ncbi:MAG: amidohydrolase family protein [Firmicutes bacterium]|nr:amidohydrolase family protein [Bacillota bacterium]
MIIDCHCHYLHPSVIDLIAQGRWSGTIRYDPEGRIVRFPTFASRPVPPGMIDLGRRLEHMDQIGVDIQILSTWVDMLGPDLPEDAAVSFHRAINEGLAEAQRAYPRRFRMLASVPLPYGTRAAALLRDAVERLGAVGALIGTQVGGRPLDDPAFEPFWREAETLAVPVVLHPLNQAQTPHLASYYLANLLGNPFDTTVAASRLIFGGILDRHPALKIVLVHGGGYLPWAVGRLDHGYCVRAEASTMAQSPSDYLTRFTYDHIVYNSDILKALGNRVGWERLVLGSDYPFDMEPANPVALAIEGGGAEAPEKMGENALRVFGRLVPPSQGGQA